MINDVEARDRRRCVAGPTGTRSLSMIFPASGVSGSVAGQGALGGGTIVDRSLFPTTLARDFLTTGIFAVMVCRSRCGPSTTLCTPSPGWRRDRATSTLWWTPSAPQSRHWPKPVVGVAPTGHVRCSCPLWLAPGRATLNGVNHQCLNDVAWGARSSAPAGSSSWRGPRRRRRRRPGLSRSSCSRRPRS